MSAQVTKAHIARARASGFSTDKGLQMAAQFIANNEDEATEAIEDLRDLARKLERELAAEREKVRVLQKALKNIKNSICRNVPDGYSQPCVDESADECDRIIDAAMKGGAK